MNRTDRCEPTDAKGQALRIHEYMLSPVVTVSPDTSARQAARRMRHDAVGCLLVTVDGDLRGIVTDRDLVVRCLAARDGSPRTPVSELMASSVITVAATDDISAAYQAFRESGVRRLPVLDERRRVVGVLTIDDLFLDVLQRLTDLLNPIARIMLGDPSDPRLASSAAQPGPTDRT